MEDPFKCKRLDSLDPIDKDIIRALSDVNLKVTPFKISQAIRVHPNTVKNRMPELDKMNITECEKKGNRLMCSLTPEFRKKFRIC